MNRGHPNGFKTPAAIRALGLRMIELGRRTADIAAECGVSETTVRLWRAELGLVKAPTWSAPVRPKPGMSLTPRGIADDFLRLARPAGAAPARRLEAHVGLAIHQLRPAAPVAVVHRIPDLDALLAAHNAPRPAPTSPPLEFS